MQRIDELRVWGEPLPEAVEQMKEAMKHGVEFNLWLIYGYITQ